METTEKELEDRLRELGIRLANPPSEVDELLRLLDQTEIVLSRVEQSPSISMSDALRPAMSSLISKEFLNHPETDVKVFVAACINEITRITAPEAPYNDSLMKEVFTMIVDSFGELDDISGRTYHKRVSILETMAKVRSCVVMLDLECNDLILQMFKHFLKTIREDHPMNVFSSMETIMALVLEESEDISQELLMCLLFNVQKSKMDTMPVAHILAKKVVGKCAMKLKPFILVAVQSMGASLSDLIASICQENSCAPDLNEVEGSKLSERTVSKEFQQESEKLDKAGISLEKVGSFADKTRNVMSNGVIPLGNANPVVEPFSAVVKPEHSHSSDPCRNDISTRGGNDNLDSIAVKPDSEKDLKHMEAKSSSVQLTDAGANSHVDGGNEASALIMGSAGCKWEAKSLKSDDVSDVVPETEVLLQPERDAELRPLEGFVGDDTCINSINPSDSPGSGHTKRGQFTSSHLIAKEGTIHKPASTARKKRKYKNPILDKEGSPGTVFALKKDHGAVDLLNEKPLQDSLMKSVEDSATVDIAISVITDAKSSARKVAETGSGKQRKPNTKQPKGKEFTEVDVSTEPSLKDSLMKSVEDSATVDIAISVITDAKSSARKVAETGSGKQRKPNTKQPKGKEFTEVDVSIEPSLKEMIASSKASRVGHKGQNHLGKYEKSSSNKKRQRDVTSVAHDGLELNEHLVGSKIEVWWPDDQQFYSGVVDAFDPKTRKHSVLYDDGDTEILYLNKELWNIVDAKKLGPENDIASSKSLEMSRKKQMASSGNFEATPESGAKSAEMSEDALMQQSDSGKFEVKLRGRPRRESSKVGSSLIEEALNSSGKEQAKVESIKTNISDEPSVDIAIIKHNTSSRAKSDGKFKRRNNLLLSGGKSAERSRNRSRNETSRIVSTPKAETLRPNDEQEGTALKSPETNNSVEEALNSSGKEQVKVESIKTNNSGEPSVDIAIIKHNTFSRVKSDGKSKRRNNFPSSGGKSAERSRDRPRNETSRIVSTSKTETLSLNDKQEGTVLKSSQTNNSVEGTTEDSTVVKDSASKGGKLDGKPKGRTTSTSAGWKSYLKSRFRGRTSKKGSTLVEEIVKTQGKDEVINSEFSEEGKLRDDTTVVKSNTSGSGSKSKDGVISTHEKFEGEYLIKPDNNSSKTGRKRKGTAAKADENVFCYKFKRGKSTRE